MINFFWQLLLRIKGALILYCSREKKNERIKLLDKIKQLEILMNSNDFEHIIQKLTDAKTVWKNSVDILKDYL